MRTAKTILKEDNEKELIAREYAMGIRYPNFFYHFRSTKIFEKTTKEDKPPLNDIMIDLEKVGKTSKYELSGWERSSFLHIFKSYGDCKQKINF